MKGQYIVTSTKTNLRNRNRFDMIGYMVPRGGNTYRFIVAKTKK